MSETNTISLKSTAQQLDRWRITNYNPADIGLAVEIAGAPLCEPIILRDKPSIEELEDEADLAAARLALEEINNDPSSVLRGEELREALAALEGSDSVEPK